MLLNSRMASIPCSTRHSIYYIQDLRHLFQNQAENPLITFPSQPTITTTTTLHYFNRRVTQRLHRYRSMKKQWQGVAKSVQNLPTSSPTCESPEPYTDTLPSIQDTIKNTSISTSKQIVEPKTYFINDYINATTAAKENNDKNSIELDPLHSRIQQDLIKLRRLIKAKHGRSTDATSFKVPTSSRPSGAATSISTAFADQETNNITIIKKASSVSKLKPLDRVKIAGCQMHPPTFPTSDSADSGIGSSSNSSSTCSQYSKQQPKPKRQNNNKTFNINRSRFNRPPPPPSALSSGSAIYRASSLKKKLNTSSNMAQTTPLKQSLPSRLTSQQVLSVVKDKQPSFIKHETPLPPIQRSSASGQITKRLYTYAASSSSAIPRPLVLNRNTSLLPILLQSSSCLGIQPQEIRPKKSEFSSEEEEPEENTNTDNDNEDYYHLLDYKQLINRLPTPVISTLRRYGQDDYGILFEQLDHIRETMPDSNTYDDYARNI